MRIQIEQLDLLQPWPQIMLRDDSQEMRLLVRLGSIPLGQVALRPLRTRMVSQRRLRVRIARELGETLLATLAQEGLSAGPAALKWFMPAAWASFDMTSASAAERRAYMQDRFLLPGGLASPLREWVIEAQQRAPSWPLPAVTVAVCTRDREASLEQSIRALQQLDYPSLEILIVNNSSDPVPTLEIAQRAGVACVRCLAPGISAARNTALAHAQHDWIAFIDDDCRAEKNWLKELIRLAQDTRCRAVVGQVWATRLESAAEIALDAYERRTAGCPGSNMLVDRAIAQQLGGFDVDLGPGVRSLGGGEDVDLLQRIRRAGFTVALAPRALVHHHREVAAKSLRRQVLGRAMGNAAFQFRRRSPLQPLWHLMGLMSEMRGALAGRSRYPFSLLLLEMKGTLSGPIQYTWQKLARPWRQQPRRIAPAAQVVRPAVATNPPIPVKPKLAA